ncbi:RCN1 [Candida theae]|uniref:RCN1 n=1 Tax=Candida theae TaxID=1198502 RepID=A0AAD5FZY2_9ASCO|nr:RCN1 [Candida theae]KAI5962786.1 RCN1 [Candida theae]
MPRSPTNTLIITNLNDDLLQDPRELIDFISSTHDLVQLIVLPRFNRFILICGSSRVAQSMKNLLANDPNWKSLRVSYSIKDNRFELNKQDLLDAAIGEEYSQVGYLELPHDLNSKRFLISPPMSPHDWDHWDKVEEGPNEKAIYSPEDLSSLLWERLGDNMVRKYQDDSKQVREEVLYDEDGVPAIILDKSENEVQEEKLPKTSMPFNE